jgi:hypothetical protein
MDKFNKLIAAVIIVAVASSGLILLSGFHYTEAPPGYALTGNFTVQSTQPTNGGVTYLLVWHGGKGTVQTNSEFSYVYNNVPVFENKTLTVTVKSSPITLYENYTKLFTLNP